jgi:hypothetical protein
MIEITGGKEIGFLLENGTFKVLNQDLLDLVPNSTLKSKLRVVGSLKTDFALKNGVYDLQKCKVVIKSVNKRLSILFIQGSPEKNQCTWWGYYNSSPLNIEAIFIYEGLFYRKDISKDKSLNHLLPQQALDRLSIVEEALSWVGTEKVETRIKSDKYIGYGKSNFNFQSFPYPTETIPFWKYTLTYKVSETKKVFDFETKEKKTILDEKTYLTEHDEVENGLQGQVEFYDEKLGGFEEKVLQKQYTIPSWIADEGGKWDDDIELEETWVEVTIKKMRIQRVFKDGRGTKIIFDKAI